MGLRRHVGVLVRGFERRCVGCRVRLLVEQNMFDYASWMITLNKKVCIPYLQVHKAELHSAPTSNLGYLSLLHFTF